MSTLGTIQPAETSKTFPEMITKLSEFFGVSKTKQEILLERIELVKDYLIIRGGLTHNGTRAVISAGKEDLNWPKDLEFKIFSSVDLSKHAKEFIKGNQLTQAWMCSHFNSFSHEMHPHQMPIFIEKRRNQIICTVFDRRINWEKMRIPFFQALLVYDLPVKFYLSTERRQYDWSTCPLLSIDDLKKLQTMDRTRLYSFFEKNLISKEISSDGKWSLVVSEHLPAIFMEFVQSINDFKKYHKWALGNHSIDQNQLKRVSSLVSKNLIVVGKKREKINDRTMQRYKKVICNIIIPRILKGKHPKECVHLKKALTSKL